MPVQEVDLALLDASRREAHEHVLVQAFIECSQILLVVEIDQVKAGEHVADAAEAVLHRRAAPDVHADIVAVVEVVDEERQPDEGGDHDADRGARIGARVDGQYRQDDHRGGGAVAEEAGEQQHQGRVNGQRGGPDQRALNTARLDRSAQAQHRAEHPDRAACLEHGAEAGDAGERAQAVDEQPPADQAEVGERAAVGGLWGLRRARRGVSRPHPGDEADAADRGVEGPGLDELIAPHPIAGHQMGERAGHVDQQQRAEVGQRQAERQLVAAQHVEQHEQRADAGDDGDGHLGPDKRSHRPRTGRRMAVGERWRSVKRRPCGPGRGPG